jgi:hypothetical protein
MADQPDKLSARMSRLLLVMAIASGWMLALGSTPVQTSTDAQTLISADERCRYSLFRLGLRWFKHLMRTAVVPLRMVLCFTHPHLAIVPKTVPLSTLPQGELSINGHAVAVHH